MFTRNKSAWGFTSSAHYILLINIPKNMCIVILMPKIYFSKSNFLSIWSKLSVEKSPAERSFRFFSSTFPLIGILTLWWWGVAELSRFSILREFGRDPSSQFSSSSSRLLILFSFNKSWLLLLYRLRPPVWALWLVVPCLIPKRRKFEKLVALLDI